MLLNLLKHDLRDLDIDIKTREEASPLVPFAKVILALDASRRRNTRPDGREVAGTLVDLTKGIEAATKRVEEGMKSKGKDGPDPSKAVANRALGFAGQLRKTLREYLAHYEGYEPLFSWWTAEPAKAANKALGDYETFLREKVVGVKPDDKTTIIGDPIGREALLADLESAMIPYTPDELIAIAEKEFAWCDAEMLRASRELGFGDDWKKALERVKTLHVAPGEQAELIRDLALEAIAYVEENGLVSIPPLAKGTWRIDMMDPEMQLVNPFFVYANGAAINVSFPTSGMTHEQKLMSMRREQPPLRPRDRLPRIDPGPPPPVVHAQPIPYLPTAVRHAFWMEGWALYWEMVLWDKGFTKTPEDRVGALFWRMHRCARIIFSLNFHLKKWTPQQCIDFLVDRVGHERDNASAEVRRSFNGNYGPLYQCAYMLGAMQFPRPAGRVGRLRHDERADFPRRDPPRGRHPDRDGPRDPRETEAPRDYKTSWKFAGEKPGAK